MTRADRPEKDENAAESVPADASGPPAEPDEPALTGTGVALPATHPRLTRAQVAERAGISKATVRRLEGKGVLKPTVAPNGVRLFAEEEVQLVSRRRRIGVEPRDPGDVAADVFTALDAGTHPVEIVKQHRIDPKRVMSLRDQWASMRGMLVFSAESRRRLAKCVGMPELKTEHEIVEAVERRIDEDSDTEERLFAELKRAQRTAKSNATLREFMDAMRPSGRSGAR